MTPEPTKKTQRALTLCLLLPKSSQSPADSYIWKGEKGVCVLGVSSFRGADCGTDPCLVVSKDRERWAVIKQAAQWGEFLDYLKIL